MFSWFVSKHVPIPPGPIGETCPSLRRLDIDIHEEIESMMKMAYLVIWRKLVYP